MFDYSNREATREMCGFAEEDQVTIIGSPEDEIWVISQIFRYNGKVMAVLSGQNHKNPRQEDVTKLNLV